MLRLPMAEGTAAIDLRATSVHRHLMGSALHTIWRIQPDECKQNGQC
jgi:hypothetical protein